MKDLSVLGIDLAKNYLQLQGENNKNDASDAQACAEAVSRKSMLFVPIKNEAQLTLQGLHRIRSFYIKQQTGLMNKELSAYLG